MFDYFMFSTDILPSNAILKINLNIMIYRQLNLYSVFRYGYASQYSCSISWLGIQRSAYIPCDASSTNQFKSIFR